MQKYEIVINNPSDEEILADIRGVLRVICKPTLTGEEYYRHGRFGRKAIRNHFGNFHNALKKMGLGVIRTGYYSDEEIIEDIIAVRRKLGLDSLTGEEYYRHGRFGRKTIRNHFGSFHNVLTKIGMEVIRTGYYSDEEIIEDVLSVKKSLGVALLTGKAYYHNGKFKKKAIEKHFGSWGKLMDKLGMRKNAVHVKHSPQELFGIMKSLWDEKGSQPRMGEFLCRCGHTQKYFLGLFKSWTDFLFQFKAYVDKGGVSVLPRGLVKAYVGPRAVSQRLRNMVLARDNYTCVECGAKKENGVKLHVDHKIPYSKGGKTELSNLRTLCETCNLKKGDKILDGDNIISE